MGVGKSLRRIKAMGGRGGGIERGKGGDSWQFKTFALGNSSGSRYHNIISISTLLLNSWLIILPIFNLLLNGTHEGFYTMSGGYSGPRKLAMHKRLLRPQKRIVLKIFDMEAIINSEGFTQRSGTA